MINRLLTDMSSVLWASLLVGKDAEFGRYAPNPDPDKKPVYINSAEYGYENFIDNMVSNMKRFGVAPRNVVMVFDGQNSKAFRQAMYPDYKAGRDHHPDSYIEFDKLRERARATFLDLGALAVEQDGYEADDVLGFLCQHLQGRKTVITGDGDLLVLHNATTDVCRNGDLNENKYGPFPFRHITLYKALVGDTTDKIKGAKGFGPKSFIEMYCEFKDEGLDVMVELVEKKQLDRLAEDVPTLKALQKIIDDQEMVYTSWNLAKLYPERIHSGRRLLKVQAGMCVQWDRAKHDERLKQFYGASRIVHAGNYDEAVRWAMPKLLESEFTALDIETDVPPEALEWLEAKKRGSGGEEGGDLGVDVFGSELVGQGVTFGNNMQYSFYMPVEHIETATVKNLKSEQVRKFVELIPSSKPLVVQNASFELAVLHGAWGEAWKDNGFHGFLPNIDDTKLMKSYVDENTSKGLKGMSKSILGYDQVSYAEVTQGRGMADMTAEETFAYGVDDTICTAALYNYLRFMMEIEETWDVYRKVEIGACYLNAMRFLQGTAFSMEKMKELEGIDDKDYDASWAVIRAYLMEQGWEGTTPPTYDDELGPAQIKEAYKLVTGEDLVTQARKLDKILILVRQNESASAQTLADLIEAHARAVEVAVLSEGPQVDLMDDACQKAREALQDFVKTYFKGEPELNFGSTPQMQKLLYETMGLPIRLRNHPTDAMRAKGIREGGAKTNDLAVQFALTYDTDKGPEVMGVLKAIQIVKMVQTRRSLYYIPYRNMVHWKDNLLHSQVNQCEAVTRRASSSGPNLQQLPKHPKQGRLSRFRETYIPHKKNAIVVSLDFVAQELVNIAEQSRDKNMLSCFLGDQKKDMHILTAVGIVTTKSPVSLWRLLGNDVSTGPEFTEAAKRWAAYTYETFAEAYETKDHPDAGLLKLMRNAGKKTNFTTEYGAMAPKLSEQLIIPTEEAQQYINAKLAAFPEADEWKKLVMEEAKAVGYTTTMMGARRHLQIALYSGDRFEVSRGERQGVNFKVQGSCAEQTKFAEGRMWSRDLFYRYDAKYIGPIHDECVSSVIVPHAVAFIKEKHACMVENYAGMMLPVKSSISLGPNFGVQIEIGEEPDEGRILEALQSLGYSVNMTTA